MINSLFYESAYFGFVLTIGTYLLGLKLKQKLKNPFAEPILISSAIIIVLLIAFGIDYDNYLFGAKYLTYFLTPVTIALALPMYRQLEILKSNFTAIIISILGGCIGCAFTIWTLAALFKIEPVLYNSLQSKSVTTAIAIGITKELGGIEAVTVISVLITGLFGSLCTISLCKIFKIKSPVAVGLAYGTASHAIGTTKAMELGEIQGAMSSLSIAVAGVMTVVIVPLFSNLIG